MCGMREVPSSSTSCREHHDDGASTPAIGLPSDGNSLVSRLLPATWYSVRFTAPVETGRGALSGPALAGSNRGRIEHFDRSTGRCALLPRWLASLRRRVFHIKAVTRRLLAEHGVPSASSYLAQDADHGVKIARRLGYPVVVKPRGRAGSAGVLRADSDDDVREAFHHALVDSVLGLEAWSVTGALVEEYLQGPEIGVETVVCAPGQIRIVAVTRKTLGPEPQFQEIGHSVDAADPLLHDSALAGVVTAAARALRLSRGVLHIELRLTSDGPRVIEVNGRPAGDLIPLLVERATGVNLPQALAVLAAGGTPDLAPTRSEAAAIGFLYPEHTGYLEQFDVHGAMRHQLWLERLVWTRDLGTQVTAAPRSSIDDRIAHWVVTGPTAADCAIRRDMVADHLSVCVSRPAHTTSCAK
ncbi:acetyl-CoA carboxylase biotin carboxylase subunit family protein [Streptomyces sp. NPDC057690]|uniref:ATP-grasp domain-containing protein n=1 Tax=Streptomyces sp. NPDC057690 TaxID=3346214 RepID=UPI003689AC85